MPRRRSAVDADLSALYAQVPTLACRGLCQDSCGPIDMSARERQRLRERGVSVPPRRQALQLLGADAGGGDGHGGYRCPALGQDGGCRVHEVRPMVCRLWGAVASLPCPHGCTPDEGLLSDADGLDLLAASLQAGGAPAELADVPRGSGRRCARTRSCAAASAGTCRTTAGGLDPPTGCPRRPAQRGFAHLRPSAG